MVLLTPGPCMTSAAVRQASALPDLNHRDPAYLELIREVKTTLVGIAGGEWVPYLIGGSGTAAMEAMVTCCAPRDRAALILENGYYSERMAELFQVHGLPHRTMNFGWLEPYNLDLLRPVLSEVGAVFATHHETTTGRLNSLDELAMLCEEAGIPLFVDAMSSFGADPLPLGISGLCSSANKCLHGLPGVSFVLLTPEVAARISEVEPLTYYLHLPRYFGDQPPLTPPVPALQAFRQALREFPGQERRRSDYLAKVQVMEKAFDELEIERLLPAEVRSSALLVARVPFGLSYEAWFQMNYEGGYVLYGCKGNLAKDWFQVSPMGETTLEQIEAWGRFVQTQASSSS